MGGFSVVPLLVLVVLLVLLALAVRAVWRGVTLPPGMRAGAPSCGSCGYAVTDLTSFTCPECGGDLREVGIDTPRREARRRGSLAGAMVGWTFLCLVFGGMGVGMLGSAGVFRSSPAVVQRVTDWSQGLTPRSNAFRLFMVTASADEVAHLQPITLELRKADGERRVRTLDASRMRLSDDGAGSGAEDWGAAALEGWFEASGVSVEDPAVGVEIAELAAFVELVAATPGPAPAGNFSVLHVSVSSSSQTTGLTMARTNWIALGVAWVGVAAVFGSGVVLIVRRRRKLFLARAASRGLGHAE